MQLGHQHHKQSSKKHPLVFLAHDIEVPMNIGSLFRTADALGVEKIYLSGSSPQPPNNKIRKMSRSTEKYVSFSYEEDPVPLIQRLKNEGYTIISLEITSSSTDIRELPVAMGEKICLILGSENVGVSQELLDISDTSVHIPMLGHCSSMNVVMACSIASFEIINKFGQG